MEDVKNPIAHTQYKEYLTYRCQFCGKSSLKEHWLSGGDECPHCNQMYSYLLAQDCEDD